MIGKAFYKKYMCKNCEESIKSTPTTQGCKESTAEIITKKLFCVCLTLYDKTKKYIICDSCKEMFHPECVGITKGVVNRRIKYCCNNCKRFKIVNIEIQKLLATENELPKDENKLAINNVWSCLVDKSDSAQNLKVPQNEVKNDKISNAQKYSVDDKILATGETNLIISNVRSLEEEKVQPMRILRRTLKVLPSVDNLVIGKVWNFKDETIQDGEFSENENLCGEIDINSLINS